jgi:hypothetical protein
MGAHFGWDTQEEVVQRLLHPDASSELLSSCLQTEGWPEPVLWMVRQAAQQRWIECCFILHNTQFSRPFGYKKCYESDGPAACNCPLEFFGKTPPEDEEWRERVREWHRAAGAMASGESKGHR